MKLSITTTVVFALSSFGAVNGFSLQVFSPYKPKAELTKFAQEQKGTFIKIDMDIGKAKNDPHMNVNGLVLELHDKKIDKSQKNKISMPGANGPRPNLSSGVKSLSIHEEPFVIDMTGMKRISINSGCWEMVWRDQAPAGSIICAFDVANEIKRDNGAVLPKGKIYMSFPVWTEDTLKEGQAKKLKYEEKVREFNLEKNDELEKMQSTSNLLMKAMHYRNAAAAYEKISEIPGSSLVKQIPSDNDAVPIGSELIISKYGTMWNLSGGLLGKDRELLGSAIASEGVVVQDKELLHP